MKTKKPFIIGITGGSGSGKTLFLQKLLENFKKEEICLVSQDNYYYPREQQPKDENGVSNFDTTQSIDFESYAQDISTLREGKKVVKKEYTFNNPSIKPSMLEFNPAPIIVVEGIFVLYYREIAQLLDLKVFIDAKDHIRLKRRILRDNDERGYDLDDVLYRYERHVIPTYEKYIEPYKKESDLIIPNNSEFSKALSMLVAFLKTKITD